MVRCRLSFKLRARRRVRRRAMVRVATHGKSVG